LVVGVIIHYEACEVHEGFHRKGTPGHSLLRKHNSPWRKVTQSIYEKDNQTIDKDEVAA